MKIVKNIYYGEKGVKEKTLDIYLPENNAFKVFIYFHGGGLESGSKEDANPFAKYLTERNIAVVSVNYRMYPTAKFPDFIWDTAEAVAWTFKNIKKYGNCEGIFIGGSSAGGYISQLLCFDPRYLSKYNILDEQIGGFVLDAGQPTSHFNVLREKNIDTRRVIVDETAPLYYVGVKKEYPKMLIIVSDNDMENRYEQTMLLVSTLKHFEYDMSKVELLVMHGNHCEYVGKTDEDNDSIFGKTISQFIGKI